ncbi:hypothetical protein T492DRAFT_865143 [Pavlovales sp. CCMP2436]|nr:hypothetical protein T492DRAFT_865143 [Pavlovales sp. CCMP2436]
MGPRGAPAPAREVGAANVPAPGAGVARRLAPALSAAGPKRKRAKRGKGTSRRTNESQPPLPEALPQADYHADGMSDDECADGVPRSDEHFLDGLSGSGDNLDKETGESPVETLARVCSHGAPSAISRTGHAYVAFEADAMTPKATHADARVVVFALEIVDGDTGRCIERRRVLCANPMSFIGLRVEKSVRAELRGSHSVPMQGFDEQLPLLLDCMHELLLPYEDATLIT